MLKRLAPMPLGNSASFLVSEVRQALVGFDYSLSLLQLPLVSLLIILQVSPPVLLLMLAMLCCLGLGETKFG